MHTNIKQNLTPVLIQSLFTVKSGLRNYRVRLESCAVSYPGEN